MMSNNIKMYLVTFVLMLACANVTMLNLVFDEDVCKEMCFKDLSTTVNDSNMICQRGCRFFFLIDALDDSNANSTIQNCYFSCTKAYSVKRGNESCMHGCDIMYKSKQSHPVSGTFASGAQVNNVSICSAAKSSNFKWSSNSDAVITEEDGFNGYECTSVHCSAIVQLVFFCVVLTAVIICTIKVMVLLYQFKLATLKYLVETTVKDPTGKTIAVQRGTSQNRNLLQPQVNV